MLHIRTASEAELARIMEIYRSAREFMARSGNPTQWGSTYPDAALIRADLTQGACRVICDEDGIRGVFALLGGQDPTYSSIQGGAWLNDEPYLTVHRLAGDGSAHGLFRCVMAYCKRRSENIRADTHADNRIMQGLLEKNGFVRCGVIELADGTSRLAYHWSAARMQGGRFSR